VYNGAHLEAKMEIPMYMRSQALLMVLVGGVTMLHSASARPSQSKPTPPDALVNLLERFADAWNRHDLDELMSMMTPDGVFEASAGNEVDGQRSEGQQAVRAAYAAVFDTFPDAHWANARHFVNGNRGVSEWTFTGTQKDGKRVEVTGCDLFSFRDGKIAIKNSYRKNRPAM
jgi:ketosteroid isomerase-like protein